MLVSEIFSVRFLFFFLHFESSWDGRHRASGIVCVQTAALPGSDKHLAPGTAETLIIMLLKPKDGYGFSVRMQVCCSSIGHTVSYREEFHMPKTSV